MTDDKHAGSLRVTARYSANHGCWILHFAHGSNGPRFALRADQGVMLADRVVDLIELIREKNPEVERL